MHLPLPLLPLLLSLCSLVAASSTPNALSNPNTPSLPGSPASLDGPTFGEPAPTPTTTTTLERRLVPLPDICIHVDALAVLGLQLRLRLCLCLATLDLAVQAVVSDPANQPLLQPLVDLLGIEFVQTSIHAALELLFIGRPQCIYPDFSRPACLPSNPCGWTCAAGYIPCAGVCAKACPSGIPVFVKRSLANQRCLKKTDTLCPVSPSKSNLNSHSPTHECLDTRSNLVSCGGCASLAPGSPGSGQDCSLLPNTDAVMCNKGACLVLACAKGFVLDKNVCVSAV